MNLLVNNDGQSADSLSMNPSDDLKSVTLCWCESELVGERTSEQRRLLFVFCFFFEQVTSYSCISCIIALLYISRCLHIFVIVTMCL